MDQYSRRLKNTTLLCSHCFALWLDNIGRAATYVQREERIRESNGRKVATVSFFSVVVDLDPFWEWNRIKINKETWFPAAQIGFCTFVRGASKIKLKNVNKKRMATARRLIFF